MQIPPELLDDSTMEELLTRLDELEGLSHRTCREERSLIKDELSRRGYFPEPRSLR